MVTIPKQLHHICRLNEFIKRYTNGESFKDCLISNDRESLIEIKRGKESLANARILAKELNNETFRIREKFQSAIDKVNYETIEKMNVLLSKIIKKSFIKELDQ